MFHKLVIVLSQMAIVGALLEDSLITPSTSELLSLINRMNQSFQMEISSLRQELNTVKQSVDKTVAFSATLSHAINSLGDGQVIIYDRVLTNTGNGYEPRHGHFTAPEAGLYHFSVTAMGKQGEVLSLFLSKNGNRVEEIYSDSSSAGYEEGSESIILYLNTGDMIWVLYGGGSRYIQGYNHNSFSGFLIK